jgi:hypothetical protein
MGGGVIAAAKPPRLGLAVVVIEPPEWPSIATLEAAGDTGAK